MKKNKLLLSFLKKILNLKKIKINRSFCLKHLQQIKNKVGARYTPELNINLPISEIFDGLCRTKKFYTTIREQYGVLIREFKSINSKFEKSKLQKSYNRIKGNIDSLFGIIEEVKEYSIKQIPWNKIQKQTNRINNDLWKFTEQLKKEKDQLKNIQTSSSLDSSNQLSPADKLNSDIQHIYKTQEALRYFENFSIRNKAQLSNNQFLLLTGSAGTGKTHLLCDIMEHKIKNKKDSQPVFLVLGEYFLNDNSFWDQCLHQLGISEEIKTKSDFLIKLNSLGKQAKCRTLFIIDALSENITHSPNFWKNNFNEIIKEIRNYPHIALAVSVRNGFEDEVLTKKQRKTFVHQEHHGFRFKEWDAVNKFFKEFQLPLPEIPLLMPEFENPLFLLLFCKAFQKRKNRKKQVFKGHEGATYIFESFILNATSHIADEFKIQKNGFKNPAYRIWSEVIKEIANEMVNENDEKISEEKLCEIIKNKYPKIKIGKFIQALESNMLILRVPRYTENKSDKLFDIKFPFQKFSDHLIGRYIFKKYEKEFGKDNKNYDTVKKFFSKRRKLGKFLSKSWNRGVIETLSIQCPEQLKGIELAEIAPYLFKGHLTQMAEEAFVESLIWRNPKAFSKDGKNTLKIINDYVVRTESSHHKLLNAFLSVAPIPNHPFNAERFHQHLSKFSMPERDSWWSTFLHYEYGENSAVDRLVEWSWSNQNNLHIKDESIYLTSIALSWFLTTPNRFIRDKATKGLVCLLQNRIHILPNILTKFNKINDPYIIERLFSVTYGCVLRNHKDTKNLKILAEWVYDNIFKYKKPPVHILLRDYARGIIEVALNRGVKIKIKKNNINPPYLSKWPKRIPTEKTLRKKYNNKTEEKGFSSIWSSVMYNFGTMGDFGNYVVSSHLHPWSARKLVNPEPNRKKILEQFKAKLTDKQKKLFEKATSFMLGVNLSDMLKNLDLSESKNKEELSEKEIEMEELKEKEERKKAYITFKKSLSIKKRKFFSSEIEPFLDDRGSINDPFDYFNTGLAQRWIFNRVIKLGYNPSIHREFDKNVNARILDRREHKSERIGKKYQWIAYHEFAALVSDHFEYKGDILDESVKEYKGPWSPYIRDIDPSFIIKNDEHLKISTSFSKWKKVHGNYDAWKKTKSDTHWIKTNRNLPNPKNLIQITDDSNNKWLTLEGMFHWQQETPPEYKKYDIPVREFYYILKSFIVKKEDKKKILDWVGKKGFGNWLPESSDFYEIFIGEYPNSFGFDDLRGDYNIWRSASRDMKIPIVVTDDSYLNEFTLDCSLNGSVSIKLPNKWLVNKLGLRQKYLDGRFYNKKDELSAITTSIFEENSPSALLIDRSTLVNFLNKNGYTIFWTLRGDKQLIGGRDSRKDFIGRLEMSGIYTIDVKKGITGNLKSNFKK